MAKRRTKRRTHKPSRTPRKQERRTRQGLSVKQTRLAGLVKRANQRLRALEKSGLQSLAYDYVMGLYQHQEMYMSTTKNGEVKFRTDISKMSKELQDDLQHQVEGFLKAKTSSVKEIKKTFGKFQEEFNKKTKANATIDDIYRAMSDANFNRLREMFGSEEATRIILTSSFGDLTPIEQQDFINTFVQDLQAYYDNTNYEPYDGGEWEQNDGLD